MEKSPKDIFFSFIVVSRNAEDTINRCADSILGQDFRDLELLIVLDTYSDTTLPVAEQIAQKDSRVRVLIRDVDTAVCQLGNARNCGIANALGRWVWFVDSDDWVSENALARIADILTVHDVDFVVCNFAYTYEERRVIKTTRPLTINRKYADRVILPEEMHESKYELFDSDLLGQSFIPCWRAIVAKSFLTNYTICFQENVAHEDNIFAMSLWLHARRVYIDSNVAYFHYEGDDSASTRRDASARQLIEVGRNCFEFLGQFEKIPSLSNMIRKEKIKAILQRYHFNKNLRVEQRIEFLALLNKEIDGEIENLINRYGDNRDIALLDAARHGEPQSYQLTLALEEAWYEARNLIVYIDDNVNRVSKTVNYVDDNLNKLQAQINYIDDNVNKVITKLDHLEKNVNNMMLSSRSYDAREAHLASIVKRTAKSLEGRVRRSLRKIASQS